MFILFTLVLNFMRQIRVNSSKKLLGIDSYFCLTDYSYSSEYILKHFSFKNSLSTLLDNNYNLLNAIFRTNMVYEFSNIE